MWDDWHTFALVRCQLGSVTGLTKSGCVRSSIPDTLDTPLTPFVFMREVLVLGALAVVCRVIAGEVAWVLSGPPCAPGAGRVLAIMGRTRRVSEL